MLFSEDPQDLPGLRASVPDLDLTGRPVTVFGGAGSALGRIAGLCHAGAVVSVITPEAFASVIDLADRGVVTWHRRAYHTSDLDEPWLVVAATGDPDLNRDIAHACEERRLWCLVDEPRGATREGDQPRAGRVTLVGGGPGDPGLLTLAGWKALLAADVVVTDRLAPVAVLARIPVGTEVIDVGKVPHGPATPQEEINRLLVEHARAGRHVVRLKGGDNFLFGRGGEELQVCAAAGVDVDVIPGVTSALAVPASARIPVTHRGLNQGVSVVSGHVPPGDPRSTVDYAALARSGTDLVLLMAVATLPDITRALLDGGMSPDTPAATIADGTLPTQRVVRSTLLDIAKQVADEGMGAPAITVIGAVAGFGAEIPVPR